MLMTNALEVFGDGGTAHGAWWKQECQGHTVQAVSAGFSKG